MHYVLRQRVMNSNGKIPISKEEFDQIVCARAVNHEALAIEEKYYILLQNYFDLERAIHDLALSNLLFRAQRWSEHVDNIHAINRELLNLLSAAKAYLDQVPQHLNAVFAPSKAESETFDKMTKNEFDAVFGYRVMSVLRNHAQHGDFPVQSLELGGKWTHDNDMKLCRNGATGFIHLDALRQNQKVNAKVRAELQSLGEKLDLKPLVRQYMSSLSRLHTFVRNSMADIAQESDQTIRAMHSRFCDQVDPKPTALAAMSVDENGGFVEPQAIFLDGLDRREYLLKRCSTVENLEFHFVSGEA